MRRTLVALLTALALSAALAGAAAAHITGPCDGETARDYATHHVSAMAKAGQLGNGGHKPGVHMGYSHCLGVH